MNKRQTGSIGEDLAANELIKKGYIILDRNYRKRNGEIDIIAHDKDYIVFIEVKYRKNIKNGYPKEAVDKRKQTKIINIANEYLSENKLYDNNCRFDVIEVLGGCEKYVNHIENAFWD